MQPPVHLEHMLGSHCPVSSLDVLCYKMDIVLTDPGAAAAAIVSAGTNSVLTLHKRHETSPREG